MGIPVFMLSDLRQALIHLIHNLAFLLLILEKFYTSQNSDSDKHGKASASVTA